MTTKRETEKETTKDGNATNGTFQFPPDFQLVTPMEGHQQWWKPEVGAVVFGRMLGRFPRKDGSDTFYYQIRIQQYPKGNLPPVRAIRGKGDEAKTVVVEIGEIINMDERSSIATLAGYAMSDGVFDVLIHCLEKVKISAGRTFWRMTAATKVIKPASSPIVQPAQFRQDDMGQSY